MRLPIDASVPAHVAAVELGYLELYGRSKSPRLTITEVDDAMLVRSPIPSPIFNGIVAPRFGNDWHDRVTDLVEEHIERGLPFQWWTGPLTHDDRVEDLLAELGMMSSGGAPGMYLDLERFDVPPKTGLEVRACDRPELWMEAMGTIVEGFGMDAGFAAPFAEVLSAFPAEDSITIYLLDDGVPVGGGTVVFVDGVVGLYNIAVRAPARERGIGRAVTVELLRPGRAAGCHGAMLHASEMGFPVYAAIGFDEVCRVHMRVWMPAAPI